VQTLSVEDHRRDSAGMTYVYPVVSRRAGGVSIGINLNINNACNWACVYCQVGGLTRGGPPPLDLARLESELTVFLDDAIAGDFMLRQVPVDARHICDVAFSGNGEPTSAPEFATAVASVARIVGARLPGVPLRLITNGSLLHRTEVQRGIGLLGAAGGEVWFKVDRASDEGMRAVNGVPGDPGKVLGNLLRCAELAPTWVQTCWFAREGGAPSVQACADYLELIKQVAGKIRGICLYGLARPSMQPGSELLQRLPAEDLAAFAAEITRKTGVEVAVHP
jgi:pyruvate-formate lyase-activating enzyme